MSHAGPCGPPRARRVPGTGEHRPAAPAPTDAPGSAPESSGLGAEMAEPRKFEISIEHKAAEGSDDPKKKSPDWVAPICVAIIGLFGSVTTIIWQSIVKSREVELARTKAVTALLDADLASREDRALLVAGLAAYGDTALPIFRVAIRSQEEQLRQLAVIGLIDVAIHGDAEKVVGDAMKRILQEEKTASAFAAHLAAATVLASVDYDDVAELAAYNAGVDKQTAWSQEDTDTLKSLITEVLARCASAPDAG